MRSLLGTVWQEIKDHPIQATAALVFIVVTVIGAATDVLGPHGALGLGVAIALTGLLLVGSKYLRPTRSIGLRSAAGTAGVAVACVGVTWATNSWPFDGSSGTRSGACDALQARLEAVPAGGGTVSVDSGTYVCTRPLVVDRDNVTLRGSGPSTVLRLADHVNRPVLVVGRIDEEPSLTRGVRVADLAIDGNGARQDHECSRGACSETDFLRNNGVSLRRVEDVVVERVTVTAARSSGVLIERGSRRVTLDDVTVERSAFDGVAGYETSDSRFTNLHLVDNGGAGLSFDLGFDANLVRDSLVQRSGDVGVFMRDSTGNTFSGLRVRDSASFGIFLAQVDADASTPAARNTFERLVVSGSGRDPARGGHGLRVNDPSCVGNVVTASRFLDNRDGAISEAKPGLVEESGIVHR